jgi:small subunit ribosomal protein S20
MIHNLSFKQVNEMAKEKEEKKEKVKRPTALKRDMRAEKMRLINKSFKSNFRTTQRAFDEALQSKDKKQIENALNNVYSAADKGVKKGIYKPNRAARLKSRAFQKLPS